MRADTGSFANYGEIEVRDTPFSRPHAVDGKSKEAVRRGATPLWVAGREMDPDVTVGESAENCISQGMQGYIGIRMTSQGLRMRNANAAQHHMIAWTESVYIETGTGAHVAEHGGLRRLGAREILRCRDLDVAGLAGKYGHSHAGPFSECGVVREIVASILRRAAVSLKQSVEDKGLRRLHQTQGPPNDGFFDGAIWPKTFDGIGHGQYRDGRAGLFSSRDGPRDQIGAGERPCGVVDQNNIRRPR